jgi:hypothetical protein
MKHVKFLVAILALGLVVVGSAFTSKTTVDAIPFGILDRTAVPESETDWFYQVQQFNVSTDDCITDAEVHCTMTIDPNSLPTGITFVQDLGGGVKKYRVNESLSSATNTLDGDTYLPGE